MINGEVAAVVIGRNEGQRLVDCLKSLLNSTTQVVYVDSGSTDDSVALAISLGVRVVELDMAQPFTAARARNAGAEAIFPLFPDVEYIQFVDGDCEISEGWVQSAYDFLSSHPEYAVACGRRRERYPDKTIYNQLCDIEWDTPIGDALACGGDALIRVTAFRSVSGFNDELIAGEEPEMCFRFRHGGWKIKRLDEEMTRHDAAMSKFSQWWKRAKRAGYAYANNYYLHGSSSEQFKQREVRSILVWGGIFPVLFILLGSLNNVFFALFSVYVLQIIRVMSVSVSRIQKISLKDRVYFSLSTVVAKWPQLFGMAEFMFNHIKGRQGRLIEYK